MLQLFKHFHSSLFMHYFVMQYAYFSLVYHRSHCWIEDGEFFGAFRRDDVVPTYKFAQGIALNERFNQKTSPAGQFNRSRCYLLFYIIIFSLYLLLNCLSHQCLKFSVQGSLKVTFYQYANSYYYSDILMTATKFHSSYISLFNNDTY